jgi:predicted RNA-binding Zn ribbon-like protein
MPLPHQPVMRVRLCDTVNRVNVGVPAFTGYFYWRGIMRQAVREPGEWIDGFLFVANQPILDFLNTKPVLENGPAELLPDVHALERWLIASGMASSPPTKFLLRRWRNSPRAAAFLKELVHFRERFREAVFRIENGQAPTEKFIKEVNSRLERYPLQTVLRKEEGKLVRKVQFRPRSPADFWAPIIDATADILSEVNTSRIRKCESCVVHFLDISRKGSRRWCSMNICGNKIKVAAYQRRKRDGASH